MKTRLVILGLLLSSRLQGNAQQALAIPDTLSGTVFTLDIRDTTHQFYPGISSQTYGVNADYLGPTLILRQGDSVTMNVHNGLADTTTIHWHGLHVDSPNDGGPHTVILPGQTWSPSFTIRDRASTFWYHPHLHMKTNLHATKGAAGMIIVRDPEEAALNLPRTYGKDDFPLVIQTKAFDANRQITIQNPYDSVFMVNGVVNPYLDAPAQVIRLRVLNASTERVYYLGLQGNMQFRQIGSDGGLLTSPVLLTRLRLGPGERAELLLDLTGMQGQNLMLMNFGSQLPNGYYGAVNPAGMGPASIPNYSLNPLNGSDHAVLQLRVGPQTANPVTVVPSTLVSHTPWLENQANLTRTLTFSPVVMGPNGMLNGPFQINNQPFDMMTVNYHIPLNNIEVWSLTNQTHIAHPFHIHNVQFYVLDVNGMLPSAGESGLKDVILVPAMQTVRFITRFSDFCGSEIPYMYHCHMLTHEDDGMMGQYVMDCPVGREDDKEKQSGIRLWPDPVSDELHIRADEEILDVTICSTDGKMTYHSGCETETFTCGVHTLPDGLYLVKVITRSGETSHRILIRK